MPLYTYGCPTCKSEVDRWHSMADVGKLQQCDVCRGSLERVWAFARKPQFVEYFDEVSGKWIGSHDEQKKIWKQTSRMDYRDTPAYFKGEFRSIRRHKARNPVVFLPKRLTA